MEISRYLLNSEADLKREIQSNEDPFLCLFSDSLDEELIKRILENIRRTSAPLETFIENLQCFPALFSTILVDQLLAGVGRNGYFEVYPILEEMLGGSIQSPRARTELWKGFRLACLSLGLQVSARNEGTHYMVNEYLRQAGLPLAYVPQFTKKASRYANEVGVPEENDYEAYEVWQNGLIERLNSPFPLVAKKAIARDQQNYYSRVFVRLLQNPLQETEQLPLLERKILESLHTVAANTRARKLTIPEIVIRDLEYGVLLPAGARADGSWLVNIDGNERSYTTNEEDRFVPFESDAVKKVIIRKATNKWEYDLWKDNRSNRFLIFSLPTGRFVKGATLAENDFYLDPGEYSLLLRFEPKGETNLERFSESPEIYNKQISLLPGISYKIQKGPAIVSIIGKDIPSLTWGRKPLRGVKGNEVFPSRGLSINVNIPKDYLERSSEYTLLLRSTSLGDDIEVHFTVPEGDLTNINLEEYLKTWQPGVSRIAVELHKRESLKVLARQSAMLWNGLNSADKRILFDVSALPVNLDEQNCINVKIDSERNILTFADDTNRFFKFVFQDGNVLRNFTWAVPGIFVNLLTYVDDGVEERRLRLGTSLPVSRISRKNIQIFASFTATLKLGSYQTHVNFSRVGSKIIPLASLLEYTTSNDNKLLLVNNDTKSVIPLVELVAPSTVESYSATTTNGLSQATFETLGHIESLRVTAQNMLDGSQCMVEFAPDANEQIVSKELMSGIKFAAHFSTDNQVSCYFPSDFWPEGFWLISYHLKVNSRWGVAMNTNSEEIADGILSSTHEFARSSEEIFQVFCENSTLEEKATALYFIHKAMMSRFAAECWHRVSWLKSYWYKLCVKYIRYSEDRELWGSLLRLATEWPDEAVAEGHVTTSILSGFLLNMFCFDRSFVPVKGPRSSSLLSCMASLPYLEDTKNIFKDQIIDVSALFGFENAALVSVGGESPRDFSMRRYIEAMKGCKNMQNTRVFMDDEWLPTKGTFLGPTHYMNALRNLKYRYLRSLSVVSERRGRVLGIIRRMNNIKLINYEVDGNLSKYSKDIDLGLSLEVQDKEELLADEQAVTLDHLGHMVRFISFLAQVCRAQARSPGVLQEFIGDLQNKCQMSNSKISEHLGYLLFMGEDIFAFYLMLWELVFTAETDQKQREREEATRPRRIYVR